MSSRLVYVLLPLVPLALFAGASSGPPATITPANPASADVIHATFTVPGNCDTDDGMTTVSGNVIRTTVFMFECSGVPPFTVTRTVSFGPLPPNTYQYEIYYDLEFGEPMLRSQQTVVVSAAPAPAVPTLSSVGISLLGMMLAALACVAISKTSV